MRYITRMATITLASAPAAPWAFTQASIPTTWQEFILPSWCAEVYIAPEAAVYVTFLTAGAPASVTTAVDGGAVGTHRVPVTTAGLSIPLRATEASPVSPTQTRLFIAAQSGTATVTLLLG